MMRPDDLSVSGYLHKESVDFKKSINGLVILVKAEMELNPFDKALFVFFNRQWDKIKILYWELNGFCLWYQRLDKERFKWPNKQVYDVISLTTQELNWLLDGFDLWSNKPHQDLNYRSVM